VIIVHYKAPPEFQIRRMMGWKMLAVDYSFEAGMFDYPAEFGIEPLEVINAANRHGNGIREAFEIFRGDYVDVIAKAKLLALICEFGFSFDNLGKSTLPQMSAKFTCLLVAIKIRATDNILQLPLFQYRLF
jgi:hypothetical protein